MKNTRYFTLFFFALLLSVIISSCKKEKEVFTTYPEPTWEVTYDEDYSVSMTAVLTIPSHLSKYASSNDRLAAFSGETCRGVGEIINGLYYVTIKGTPDEEANVYFQYYSGRNKYLYKTPILFQFEKDEIYGTADEPKTLPLSVVE